ncbi:shikimate kinase [Bombilactobacillus bombi]
MQLKNYCRHVGKILSQKLNLPFQDLDEVIISQSGKSIAKILIVLVKI